MIISGDVIGFCNIIIGETGWTAANLQTAPDAWWSVGSCSRGRESSGAL